MSLIERAKMIATIIHSKQTYDEHDYTYHLEQVYKTLLKFGVTDDNLLVAAWLHDGVEDQQLKIKHVQEYFNDEIADIVFCVTDEIGSNRRERHEKTYPKIRKNQKAACLKLADRISNVEQCLKNNNQSLFSMYLKEYPGFKSGIYMQGYNEEMWKHLDQLMYASK